MPSYADMSKTALAEKLERKDNQLARERREGEKLATTLGRTLGASVTGPATAGLTGFIEGRVRNKDGTMLSLGPVPLPVCVGVPALVGSVFDHFLSNQLAFVASAQFGLAAGTLGRAYGTAARIKKGETVATSDRATGLVQGDDWSEEERELLDAA